MSKLLDSLRKAARSRSEAAQGDAPSAGDPGLLQQALQRAAEAKANAATPARLATDPGSPASLGGEDRYTPNPRAERDAALAAEALTQAARQKARDAVEAERAAEARHARERQATEALQRQHEAEMAAAAATRQKLRAEAKAAEAARQRAEAEEALAEAARVTALENKSLAAAAAQRERLELQARKAAEARAAAEREAARSATARAEAERAADQAAQRRADAEAALGSTATAEGPATTPPRRSISHGPVIPGSWKPAFFLVMVLGGIVAFSWHVTRQGEKLARLHSSPAVMKLDYQLDLSRAGAAARSSPPGPAPSR